MHLLERETDTTRHVAYRLACVCLFVCVIDTIRLDQDALQTNLVSLEQFAG